MRHALRMVLGIMAAALVLGLPASAFAAWPLSSGRTAPVLGFGADYVHSTTTSVHRGLDIGGQAGESVIAPLAGTVTFVGRVPGAGGATVLAVTLQTAAGSVTLLPLDLASVVRGDTPQEGDAIATLAATGDESSSATHLHIGLRNGSLYLDPTAMLAPPPAPVSEPDGAGAEAGAPAGAEAAVAPPVPGGAAGAQVGAGAAAGGSAAAAGSGLGVPATGVWGVGAKSAVPGGAGSAVVMRGGELAPGVSLASGSGVPAAGGGPVGVLGETGQAIATGGRLARAASSAVSDGRLGALALKGVRAAKRGARSAALVAVGVLCALGALWPLWRAGGLEGTGKLPVSAVREDVAAVASR